MPHVHASPTSITKLATVYPAVGSSDKSQKRKHPPRLLRRDGRQYLRDRKYGQYQQAVFFRNSGSALILSMSADDRIHACPCFWPMVFLAIHSCRTRASVTPRSSPASLVVKKSGCIDMVIIPTIYEIESRKSKEKPKLLAPGTCLTRPRASRTPCNFDFWTMPGSNRRPPRCQFP